MIYSVLFVCVQNSCRSQMAEGLARHYGGGRIEPFSCGSRPSGVVHPQAVEVLAEIGIDISAAKSKGCAALSARTYDFVVGMGCSDVCPVVPGREYLVWNIPDPQGGSREEFRAARDLILHNVREFFLTVPPA
ncbi:MAG: arsenate reductase ArsC [Candidatus Omnitrophica bacterium]|nr:arsenate reductase ArsC [Candidatus Omnitrophota bacterium]